MGTEQPKKSKKPYQPKKMLAMNILDILRKYTNAQHRLSQRNITDILKDEYGMAVERKTIRRNILSLMEAGTPP